MAFKPADDIQDLQYFGEFGGVNPSVSDATTFTFVSAKTMSDTFEGNTEGCHLYARHTTPSNLYLGEALAALEGTETANVFGSGMGAITAVLHAALWCWRSCGVESYDLWRNLCLFKKLRSKAKHPNKLCGYYQTRPYRSRHYLPNKSPLLRICKQSSFGSRRYYWIGSPCKKIQFTIGGR